MSEVEFNKIFSRRLRYFLSKNNLTQKELAKRLGVGTTSVSDWVNGRKTPRMSKVDAMCELFHCNRSDLITDSDSDTYYTNAETARAAQEIFDNEDMRILFDAARDSRPEDLRMAADMLKRFKESNPDA